MSKSLEALEIIKNYKEWRNVADITGYKKERVKLAYNDELKPLFYTIEKELKEYEQYKTTEKEFGIDLLTLIKALKNGIYSSFVDSSNKRIILKSNEVLLLKTLDGLDCFFEDNDERFLLFSDYGKTWALTKEELLCNTK